MAAWAWPVEGWELLDTDDDDFSDEAELGVADEIAAAVGEDDPQEGANINGMVLLSQHFGDS
jgi:hypothetical protein